MIYISALSEVDGTDIFDGLDDDDLNEYDRNDTFRKQKGC